MYLNIAENREKRQIKKYISDFDRIVNECKSKK